ncbi:MAG TPA: hypothetical protein VHB73_06045 [Alphaproteobacteria bacterium]|nr:hypothetical protein [Alphaproteobacteria bacterium]
MLAQETTQNSYRFAEAKDAFLTGFQRARSSISKKISAYTGDRKSFAAAVAAPILITLAALNPAQGQTVMVAPAIGNLPMPSMPTAEIPKEQCNYLFDRASEALKNHDKNFISRTTKKSLIAFWKFENDLPTCKGPREIAWEREGDYHFVIALGDSAYGAFKGKADFVLGYGFRPAAQKTDPAVGSSTPPGGITPPAPGS